MKKNVLYLFLYISYLLAPNTLLAAKLKNQLQALQHSLGGLKSKLAQLDNQLTALKVELEDKGTPPEKKLAWKKIDNVEAKANTLKDIHKSTKLEIFANKQSSILKELSAILKLDTIDEIKEALKSYSVDALDSLSYKADILINSSFDEIKLLQTTLGALLKTIEIVKNEKSGVHAHGSETSGAQLEAIKTQLRNKLKNAHNIKTLEDFADLFALTKAAGQHAQEIIEGEWNLMLNSLKQEGKTKSSFQTQGTRNNLAKKINSLNVDRFIQLSGFPESPTPEETLKQNLSTFLTKKTGKAKASTNEEWYVFFQRTVNEVIDGANPIIEGKTSKAVHTVVQELRSEVSTASKPEPTKKPQKTAEEKAALLKKMLLESWDFATLSANLGGIEALTEIDKENLKNLVISKKDTVNIAGKNVLSKALTMLGLSEDQIIDEGFPKPPAVATVGSSPIKPKPSKPSSEESSSTETGGTSSGNIHPAQQKDNIIQVLNTMQKPLGGGPPPPPPTSGPPPPPSPENLYDLNKQLTEEQIEIVITNRGGVEKLAPIQKAGLKNFIEKKKAEFMTSDQGKEVLTKLGIT